MPETLLSLRFVALHLSALGLLAIGAPGCGDPNAGKLFVDMQYAARCDMTLGCPGTTTRDICGINAGDPCNEGAEPVTASCSISQGDTSRTLTFSASQPVPGEEDFSIRVSGAMIANAGGSAGGGCQVRVREGANTYEGACGSSAPSEAQPCQINSVMFTTDPEDGVPVVEGAIFCQFLPNQSQPSLELEVSAIGAGPDAASTPAYFRIRNCSGLTL